MCEYINGAIIQEDFKMEKYIFDEGNGLWYELRNCGATIISPAW